MEVSALCNSHTVSSATSIALLTNHRKWEFSFNKQTPSFRSRSSFFIIKNVASKKQTQKQQQQEQGGALDALKPDSASIASSIKYHAEFTPSFSPELFELPKAYYATAQSVRDVLVANWNTTYDHYEKVDVKQAYYLSMEFLQGRALLNAIGNLELKGPYAEALKKLGHDLEDVAKQEPDAALGNGGLGRLASCFLDSMATLNYPAWGYGLRYRYGLFKQLITKDGQEEVAENWLEMGNPWEIIRNDISYPIKFYGEVVESSSGNGKKEWIGGENIVAVAYDVPIPGYKTKTTINLRLWSTKVNSEVFDLRAFNNGDHPKAYEAMKRAEKICYILYPGDESYEGKTLRLKQQYTLCSASLQDIVSRFERRCGELVNWENFPEKVAVQMNDTHPTLCIPELIRILVDVKGLSWNEAWAITQRTVAYTNHTVLPEALEKWSLDLLQELLPRHVEIIRLIDEELVSTIVEEYGTEDLDLLKEKLNEMRILDNIELPCAVLDLLVKSHEIPVENSVQTEEEDSESDEVAQIKRIHEYKRQLLNILGIVYRYKKMKEMSAEERKSKFVPRVCIFGGKAFATYVQAKRIVKFITDVGATVNHDPEIGDLLKVIFVPDYNVSVAEVLIPATELSQHISTAGMEASGTSNMKFAMKWGGLLFRKH
ncbi:hypothetical protein MIMGU_mgv1a002585mg [Erythranthe guttata]|uniref:Alpha-1,4 glucan phosphorylase n=1 Tax=Erythranthe guttata TaxID=4155 RepID=A0A022QNF9_ERYGU|nr:hypothetical protein MIMGU_mgv1a002585mg [Erythranthe guttata]EYU28843.1 hypothetical protein MIMGU_mgv1a002585mg [Erythranthe guttata]